MAEQGLTDSSYVVLGLVKELQPATVYDLKRLAHSSTFNFWAMPHTALYTESEQLRRDGYLSGEQETSGRRRRAYRLTAKGSKALERWLESPIERIYELKDPGLLRLFFGAEPTRLAQRQIELHEEKLDEYEQLRESLEQGSSPDSMLLTLDAGIAIEREYLAYWRRLSQ